METLGQFLKREREFRGISLENLSGLTRINPGVLKRIEEDDLGTAPQSVYLKSFLKTYAGQLGLDPREILNRYADQALEKSPRDLKPDPLKPDPNDSEGGLRPLVFLIPLVLAALITLAIFLLKR